MTGEEVANAIGEDYRQGYGLVRVGCYNTQFHNNDDNDPSLVIYDGDRGYYCFACGVSGSHEWLMKQYGIESSVPRGPRMVKPKSYKEYDFNDIQRRLKPLKDEYISIMKAKGISESVLRRLGWYSHNDEVPGWGQGMYIPYRFEGKTVAARLRMTSGMIRFKSLPGGESFPYMADNAKKKYCYVNEGETDAITMAMNGYPAVGIPGATNSQAIKKLVAIAKDSGTTLCVVPDNDKAGNDFADRIMNACFKEGVKLDRLKVPYGKDVNEWYNLVGAEKFKEQVKPNTRGVIG